MTINEYQTAALRTAQTDKLKARYPDGFSTDRSLHRDKNDV